MDTTKTAETRRTVDVAEFKKDPAATTRRAMNEGSVAVVRGSEVLLVVSFPKAPASLDL